MLKMLNTALVLAGTMSTALAHDGSELGAGLISELAHDWLHAGMSLLPAIAVAAAALYLARRERGR